MRTINSIRQLKDEKKRMRRHRELLEDRMKENWKGLKEQLKPRNLVSDAIGTTMKNKLEGDRENDSLLKTTLLYGISLLADKFAGKAGEKLGKFFKKGEK